MLKLLVRFTLPILIFALSAPSVGVAATAETSGYALVSAKAMTGAASATLHQLETVGRQVDVLAAAGAISAGVAKSLKAKVEAGGKAIEKGDSATVGRIVDAFVKEVEAQTGRGIAASVADLLIASASGSPAATAISVPVGVATIVATQIGSSPVAVALPGGSSVAWIRFGAAENAVVPRPPASRRLVSIDIRAFDSFGAPVTQLGGPVRLSIGFQPAASVNTGSARIGTLTSTGALETLVTQITDGSDALTATALTTHLSPFVLDALTTDPPWRFTYVTPPTITAVSPSTGSPCGNTTVVLSGSGLGNVYGIDIEGNHVQSFTINSDSQITAITSAAETTPGGLDIGLSAYLTSTALPPEYANTTLTIFDGSFVVSAVTGTNYPGTPTYNAPVQPVLPRVTGMTPNQGPTIGAPNHPSQDFTNPAIRILGCGFSGATAVLFGLTPSPSFTVQSDSILFAVPPTPASGTVDVRVVTPLGISSILP
jgi:hypothetical protein